MSFTDSDIAEIVSRHIHDVRNHANVLRYDVSFLTEIVPDSEVQEVLQRMERQFVELESTLRGLTASLGVQRPTPTTASELFDLWQGRVMGLQDATHQVIWDAPEGGTSSELDSLAVAWVLRELILEAWAQAPGSSVRATVKSDENALIAMVERSLAGGWTSRMPIFNVVVLRNGGLLESVTSEDKINIRLIFPATVS